MEHLDLGVWLIWLIQKLSLPFRRLFPVLVVCSPASARQRGLWKVQAGLCPLLMELQLQEAATQLNPYLAVCVKMRWTRD